MEESTDILEKDYGASSPPFKVPDGKKQREFSFSCQSNRRRLTIMQNSVCCMGVTETVQLLLLPGTHFQTYPTSAHPVSTLLTRLL